MKKIILLLFLALTVCIVSCSKDDDGKKPDETEKPNETEKPKEPEEPTTLMDEKLLIGTWKIENHYVVDYKKHTHYFPISDCEKESTLSFKDDKTYKKILYGYSDEPCKIEKTINAKWELKNNLISFIEDEKEAEVYEVIELTEDKLHLKDVRVYSEGEIIHITYKK